MASLAHARTRPETVPAFDVCDHVARSIAAVWHESGHAAIARVLQVPAGSASIAFDAASGSYGMSYRADPDYCLQVWRSRGKQGTAREARDACCIVVMAGAEAERLFLGSACDGDWHDRAKVRKLLASDASLETQLTLRTTCLMLVHKHRKAIERVANALLRHETLSGDELDRFVAKQE